MYAIIATGGKQYTVSEGDVIKSSCISIREKLDITRRTVTDSSSLRIRLKRLMLNY